jgi:ubiquinone/menaquinone biosynthesis C-methylase UbiE
MTANDPYRDIAPYYDLEFDDFDADIDLYVNYAGIVGDPMLDIGCGTGRVLAQLALAGYHVTGIDPSPSMLALARKRVADQGVSDRVQLREGDVRDLSSLPENHVRLALCAINSFLHLTSRSDHLVALESIRRVLHRNGILALDIMHPTPAVIQRMDDTLRHDGSWTRPDGTRVDRFSQRRVRVSEQMIETLLFYDRSGLDGVVARTVTSYLTRYIHRFEMESLLAQSGFELEGIYGSYQLDPLDDDSEQMIVVAHRAPWPGEE